MTASITSTEFGRAFTPRERNRIWPHLALRRRSADHPMAMFAVVAGAALISMAFTPSSGPAFASFNQPAKIGDEVKTTTKTSRLPLRGSDSACRGQAWGAESYDCLVQIARDSGKSETVRVRRLALAGSLADTSAVF